MPVTPCTPNHVLSMRGLEYAPYPENLIRSRQATKATQKSQLLGLYP